MSQTSVIASKISARFGAFPESNLAVIKGAVIVKPGATTESGQLLSGYDVLSALRGSFTVFPMAVQYGVDPVPDSLDVVDSELSSLAREVGMGPLEGYDYSSYVPEQPAQLSMRAVRIRRRYQGVSSQIRRLSLRALGAPRGARARSAAMLVRLQALWDQMEAKGIPTVGLLAPSSIRDFVMVEEELATPDPLVDQMGRGGGGGGRGGGGRAPAMMSPMRGPVGIVTGPRVSRGPGTVYVPSGAPGPSTYELDQAYLEATEGAALTEKLMSSFGYSQADVDDAWNELAADARAETVGWLFSKVEHDYYGLASTDFEVLVSDPEDEEVLQDDLNLTYRLGEDQMGFIVATAILAVAGTLMLGGLGYGLAMTLAVGLFIGAAAGSAKGISALVKRSNRYVRAASRYLKLRMKAKKESKPRKKRRLERRAERMMRRMERLWPKIKAENKKNLRTPRYFKNYVDKLISGEIPNPAKDPETRRKVLEYKEANAKELKEGLDTPEDDLGPEESDAADKDLGPEDDSDLGPDDDDDLMGAEDDLDDELDDLEDADDDLQEAESAAAVESDASADASVDAELDGLDAELDELDPAGKGQDPAVAQSAPESKPSAQASAASEDDDALPKKAWVVVDAVELPLTSEQAKAIALRRAVLNRGASRQAEEELQSLNKATVTASNRGAIDYSRLAPKAPGADGEALMVIAIRPAPVAAPGSKNYLAMLAGEASPECISQYERQQVSHGYSALDGLAMLTRATEPSDYFGQYASLASAYRGARAEGRTVLAGQIMGRLRAVWAGIPEGSRSQLSSPSALRRMGGTAAFPEGEEAPFPPPRRVGAEVY